MPNGILSLPSSGDPSNSAPPAWAEGFGEPFGFVSLRPYLLVPYLLPPTPPVPVDPEEGQPLPDWQWSVGDRGGGSEGRAGRMVLEPWADGEGSLDKVPAAGSEPFPSQGNRAGLEDSRHRARAGGPLLWSVRKALLPGPRPSISQQWSWGPC